MSVHTIGKDAATNCPTHLLWCGRWIPAVEVGDAWEFDNGTDASDWILWPEGEEA